MDWRTDIENAPRGKYEKHTQFRKGVNVEVSVYAHVPVILSTKCRKVIKSKWLGNEKAARWEFLKEGEQPMAWMPWPEPYGSEDE